MNFAIQFDDEAGETAERIIDSMETFCVELTLADGTIDDYILLGHEIWDGEEGMPLKVRRCNEVHAPTGPVITVDAVQMLVH